MNRNALKTLDAQSLTKVSIDGVLYEREPWNPTDLAERLGFAWMDESTPCNDCGVVAGQLHWPFCDQDYIPAGQLLGLVSDLSDYRRDDEHHRRIPRVGRRP